MKKITGYRPSLTVTVLAFFAAYSSFCRWFDFFQRPLLVKISLLMLGWLGLILADELAWRKFPKLRQKELPHKAGATASLLGALLLMEIFHWQPPAFPSTYQITIKADGSASLADVVSGDRHLPLDRFIAEGAWQLTSAGWQHSGTDENSLYFSGSLEAPLKLIFATAPDAGRATVSMGKTTVSVNLNTPLPDAAIVEPFAASLGQPSLMWVFWAGLLALAEWLLLSFVLYRLFSRHAAGSIAAGFPFLFLLPYVTTIAGHNVTLGNDFGPFYYVYKTYLLDFLSNGYFPLWSPSEGAGFAFFSDPLTQTVYPPNLLLALIYRLNGGYTRLDHQVFTVCAISWFSLGLYAWLRSLRVEKRFAVFSALTIALSYKMVELLRFPNAAHEAAWYPWILLALTGLFIAGSWKTVWKWSVGLAIALICLFTAGYPYYVYYLPFLAGPYLLFMVIPSVRSRLFAVDKPDWRKFISGFSAACLLAVLVCGPYLVNMAQTVAQTSGRAGDDFTHATMYPFDFMDTLESLAYPPAARPEGWFYFGALGLTLMVIYLAHPAKDSVKDETPQVISHRSLPVKIALAAWLIFLSYLSYGEQSLLFLLFYRILPEFSALRGWGRLSIALLPGLALLLAFSVADFESRLRQPTTGRINRRLQFTLATVLFFSLGLQVMEYSRSLIDEYWDLYFIPRTAYLIQTVANTLGKNIIPDPAGLSSKYSVSYMAFSLLAAGLIVVFLLKFRIKPGREWLLPALLGVFSLVNLWPGGPWLWNNGFAPEEERKTGNFARMMSQALSTSRKNEDSTLTLSPAFSVGSPPKWHFARYQDFYFGNNQDTESRDKLLGVTDGNRFFYSQAVDHSSIPNFLQDAGRYQIDPIVHEYTGDSLLVELDAPEDGYFSFIDNWDPNWKARVDGSPVEIEKLLGTFKSVELTAGRHEISMAYCPRFFEWANPACSR